MASIAGRVADSFIFALLKAISHVSALTAYGYWFLTAFDGVLANVAWSATGVATWDWLMADLPRSDLVYKGMVIALVLSVAVGVRRLSIKLIQTELLRGHFSKQVQTALKLKFAARVLTAPNGEDQRDRSHTWKALQAADFKAQLARCLQGVYRMHDEEGRLVLVEDERHAQRLARAAYARLVDRSSSLTSVSGGAPLGTVGPGKQGVGAQGPWHAAGSGRSESDLKRAGSPPNLSTPRPQVALEMPASSATATGAPFAASAAGAPTTDPSALSGALPGTQFGRLSTGYHQLAASPKHDVRLEAELPQKTYKKPAPLQATSSAFSPVRSSGSGSGAALGGAEDISDEPELVVSQSDFNTAFHTNGDAATAELADLAFNIADANDDGTVSQEEFVRFLVDCWWEWHNTRKQLR